MIALIIKKIKHFFSLKIVTLSILIIVIISRIIQLIFLFNIRSDRSYQTIATQNLLSGHGISMAEVLPGNLSEIFYEPIIKWPPSYSLLLAPFYFLFNHNFIIAGIALDIFFAIFLIFITRNILKTLNIQVYLINIYTVLTGFILYSFYTKTSSDAIAITFFLFAIQLSLLLLKNNKFQQLKLSAIIISLLFCATTKYLYMPVVFIVPLFFLIKGVADKDFRIKRAGYISFLLISCIIAALLLYQKTISGSAVYITQPTRGFYPQNLFSLFPAFPGALINPETVALIVHKSSEPAGLIYSIYQWLNLLIMGFFIIYGCRVIYKKRFTNLQITSTFFYLTFFLSFAILVLLMLLSLIVEKENNFWTYVQEPRYYGLTVILLQLSFFIFYQYNYNRYGKSLRYAFLFALLLMLPDMSRGIIFSTNRISNFKKEEASWQIEYRLQQFADGIIKREEKIHRFENSVITGSSDYINNRISLYNHIPIMTDVLKINDLSSLNSKTSVLLLIVLRDDALQDFQPFLSLTEKKEQGQFNGFHFYTIYVTLH